MYENTPKVKKHHLLLWLGVVVLVVAVVVYERHSGSDKARRGMAPQRVGVARVVTGPMPEAITALGTVTPLASGCRSSAGIAGSSNSSGS